MRRYKLLLLITLLSLSAAVAQEYHYRGNVLDDATGEPLIGANVYAEPKGAGAVTDGEGLWSFTSKQRVKRLIVSYVGYKSKRITSPRQADQRETRGRRDDARQCRRRCQASGARSA